MSTTTENMASVLNSLIEACKDSQEGFRDAARQVKNADYKSLFAELANQRQMYMGELRRMVMSLGEPAEDSGSFAGSLHRGWMDLKAALSSGDEHAILEECERGEDFAVSRYRVAMEHKELPGSIRTAIERQYAGVQAAHDRVRALRDRTGK
jgi:uncharacterized protein (TIGR02284 family)